MARVPKKVAEFGKIAPLFKVEVAHFSFASPPPAPESSESQKIAPAVFVPSTLVPLHPVTLVRRTLLSLVRESTVIPPAKVEVAVVEVAWTTPIIEVEAVMNAPPEMPVD